MKCKQCGIEMPEGVKFCPACGASTSGDEPKANEAPKAEPAKTEPNAAAGSGSTTITVDPAAAVGFLKKNKKVTIGAAAAVVVAIIAIIAFVMISSNVPEDIVKNDLMETDLVKSGAVSSNYVNEADYSITELKIEKQADEDITGGIDKVLAGSDKCRRVDFSGKMSNGNFETSFRGHSYYVKSGDTWSKYTGEINAEGTKPLKGVDTTFVPSAGFTGTTARSSSDFSSTFEESNGTYTSVATERLQYTYSFVTDTAVSTSTFEFDPDKGWQRQGEADLSDINHEWYFNGKTFTATSTMSGDGTTVASISFIECSGDSAKATYSLNFTPKSEKGFLASYNAVDLKGSMSGTFKHEFGKNSYEIELSDSGNSVTYEFSGTDQGTSSSQQKTAYKMYGSVSTNAVYETWLSGATTKLKLSSVSFEEKTTV